MTVSFHTPQNYYLIVIDLCYSVICMSFLLIVQQAFGDFAASWSAERFVERSI